jgi:threonine/homoserine/homoserine lactone efflux protein
MTISTLDLAFYALAVFVLFLTPGPVWVALIARALSGGFQAAWPLAAGVIVGDAIWPVVAVLGVSWVVQAFSGFMTVLRLVAVVFFIALGLKIIRHADHTIARDRRLTRPGIWAGFAAGVAVIMSNPKAVLFYMGVLPGFFDLTTLTVADVAAIALVSMLVPFVGNAGLALFVDRARRMLASPLAVRRVNLTAGCLLICVGLIIPFT